jgi:Arc/MetJ-type ribon-helix-helix transcriptional regulator
MMYRHTTEAAVAKTKIAVTLDGVALARLDRLVDGGVFPNRSQAIEVAVLEKLDRLEHRRLAAECAKLDPAAEQALADEGLGADGAAWPPY